MFLLVATYWAIAQATSGTVVNGEPPHQLSEAYVVAGFVPTPIKTYAPLSWTYCSCVNFAKAYLGVKDEVWGWAAKIVPNVTDPAVGDVLLTTEGGGHAAVITKIVGTTLTIIEANYQACKVTTRTLQIGDPRIRGYKRVWLE